MPFPVPYPMIPKVMRLASPDRIRKTRYARRTVGCALFEFACLRVTLPVWCFVLVVEGPADLVTVVIVVVFGAADVEVAEEELLVDVRAGDEEELLVVALDDDEELLEEVDEDDVVVAGVEDLVDDDEDDEDEAADEEVLVVSFIELDEDVLDEVPLLPFPLPLFPSPLPLLASLAFFARRLL